MLKRISDRKQQETLILRFRDNMDGRLQEEEKRVLSTIVDAELLTQYSTLLSMESNMLGKEGVKEAEKDIVRQTHSQWLNKQLTAEQYQLFSSAMDGVMQKMRLELESVSPTVNSDVDPMDHLDSIFQGVLICGYCKPST